MAVMRTLFGQCTEISLLSCLRLQRTYTHTHRDREKLWYLFYFAGQNKGTLDLTLAVERISKSHIRPQSRPLPVKISRAWYMQVLPCCLELC